MVNWPTQLCNRRRKSKSYVEETMQNMFYMLMNTFFLLKIQIEEKKNFFIPDKR